MRALGNAISGIGGNAGRGSAESTCTRNYDGSVTCKTAYNESRPTQVPIEDPSLSERCSVIEQHELASRRQRAAEDAEQERRANAERRAQDAQRATIRRRPKPPELRGTPAEASALCAQQMGKVVADDTKLSCQVGGVPIFTCTLDSEQRFDRCDTYFEDGDILEFRKASQEQFGPPTSESVSPQGFRVWVWKEGNTTVAVGMYAHGVRTSIMLEASEAR